MDSRCILSIWNHFGHLDKTTPGVIFYSRNFFRKRGGPFTGSGDHFGGKEGQPALFLTIVENTAPHICNKIFECEILEVGHSSLGDHMMTTQSLARILVVVGDWETTFWKSLARISMKNMFSVYFPHPPTH
jgi:hypothetical protein